MSEPLRFFYGTAWKEERTRELVALALRVGFRAIDTANQRMHYFEAAVGEALEDAYESGVVRREDLFLQTKFTQRGGQDDRLPYDPRAPIAEQVRRSFESSLEHLRTGTIDSLLLHGPTVRHGLAQADLEAWSEMERLQREGLVGSIGVSNVTRAQLELLLERATVRPASVQNRCYASAAWDREVRTVCRDHGIAYQAFSLLTVNRRELASPSLLTIARRRTMTPAQLVFRFARDVGMTPLTGTSSEAHMREDLAELPSLDDAELRAIETISTA